MATVKPLSNPPAERNRQKELKMETAILIASIIVYTAIYFFAKLVTRWVIKAEHYDLMPKFIGLAFVIAASVTAVVWARFNLVDPNIYNSLSEFDQGRYIGRVMGAFLFPSVVSAIVIMFRIWRTRKKQQAMHPAPL